MHTTLRAYLTRPNVSLAWPGINCLRQSAKYHVACCDGCDRPYVISHTCLNISIAHEPHRKGWLPLMKCQGDLRFRRSYCSTHCALVVCRSCQRQVWRKHERERESRLLSTGNIPTVLSSLTQTTVSLTENLMLENRNPVRVGTCCVWSWWTSWWDWFLRSSAPVLLTRTSITSHSHRSQWSLPLCLQTKRLLWSIAG